MYGFTVERLCLLLMASGLARCKLGLSTCMTRRTPVGGLLYLHRELARVVRTLGLLSCSTLTFELMTSVLQVLCGHKAA